MDDLNEPLVEYIIAEYDSINHFGGEFLPFKLWHRNPVIGEVYLVQKINGQLCNFIEWDLIQDL